MGAVLDVAGHMLYIQSPINYVQMAESITLHPGDSVNVTVQLTDDRKVLLRKPIPFYVLDEWGDFIENVYLQFVDKYALVQCVNNGTKNVTLNEKTIVGKIEFQNAIFVCTKVATKQGSSVNLFSEDNESVQQKEQRKLIFDVDSRRGAAPNGQSFHNLHIDAGETESDGIASPEHSEIATENMKRYPWLEATDKRLHMTRDQVIDSQLHFTDTLLSEEQQKAISEIVHRHSNAFAAYDEVGCLKGVEYHLEVKDDYKPFLHRAYPVSPGMLTKVAQELTKLESHGIIEKGKASSFSPVFARPKSDGKSIRLVLDARELNKNLLVKKQPMLTRPELHVKIASKKKRPC